VIFELSGVLYLYRDFITVLTKIAATVTLMDKIKMEPTTLVDKIKKNPQKWRKKPHWI